jgi:hypothetical protein
MKKIVVVLFVLLLGSAGSTFAQDNQDKKWISGNSFQYMLPQGDLADDYNYGLGIYGSIDYNFNKNLAWRFDLGWNDLEGDEKIIIDTTGNVYSHKPKISVWEFTTGFKASVSIFYVEARGGYFTGVHEWGIVPAVGLRIGKFDVQGNYKLVGDSSWFGARIGFYWGS